MKRILITTTISLMLSAALLSGIQDLSTFAYYVALVFNVLGWLALLSGTIKGSVARKVVEHMWLSTFSSVVQLGALVFSGHPLLATSYFISTVLLVSVALSAKEEKPCES